LKQLKAAVFDIWDNEITVDDFRAYIDEIPDRIAQVIEREGAQIKY